MTYIRWKEALNMLGPAERHHAGPTMDNAYETLKSFYTDIEIISFQPEEHCGDWSVPLGWIVDSAKIFGPDGKIVCDYAESPLRLFAYSPSFEGEMNLEELSNHLMSDPNRPDMIPYHFRNQYRPWESEWGFCLTHNERASLKQGNYRVEVKTRFIHSELKMALHTHQGTLPETLLIVGHFDHPGQSGDGLIGCLAGHEALSRLKDMETKLTYRMLSTVEIVGSVFYANRRANYDGVQEALFSSLSGVDAPLKYSQSAKSSASIDRVMSHVISVGNESGEIIGFREGIGNDEIAFDLPPVGIPCGSLMRWPYDYYHTNLDTADKISEQRMESFINILISCIDIFENNAILFGRYESLPRLSKPEINLYLDPDQISGINVVQSPVVKDLLSRLDVEQAKLLTRIPNYRLNKMMTLLVALADGEHTTLGIAEDAGVPFFLVDKYTDMWEEKGLLTKEWMNPFQPEVTST